MIECDYYLLNKADQDSDKCDVKERATVDTAAAR